MCAVTNSSALSHAEYARQVSPEMPLDRGIVPAVRILRDAGIETYESCEGGEGHVRREPTVWFHGQPTEGLRAVSVALSHGLRIRELRRCWSVDDGELTGPYWTLVLC
jgi:hypothetical protein